MERVEMPDGGWVEFYAPEEVPERRRRPLIKVVNRMLASPAGAVLAISALTKRGEDVDPFLVERAKTATDDDDEIIVDFQDALILAYVRAWSYGDGVVSADVLGDLPGKASYDPIFEACPGVDDLMPNFAVSPDEESPTGPSSA